MDLCLYLSMSGVFIAVPECLRPPIEAEHQHGPLEFHRRLRLDDEHVTRVSPHLMNRIDADFYAVITPDEASRLTEAALAGAAPRADDPVAPAHAPEHDTPAGRRRR